MSIKRADDNNHILTYAQSVWAMPKKLLMVVICTLGLAVLLFAGYVSAHLKFFTWSIY